MKNKLALWVVISFFLASSSAYAAVTATYTYDQLGRVTQVIYSNGTKITYTYDAAGNRLQQVVTCPATGC